MSGPARVAGAGLVRAAAIMDQLRSPGGCPWDAEQTHASLGRYLVEECYELLEAIEDGDESAIREELGDVLLQVLFHARIAAERPAPDGGFDIDDVADGLTDKLIRRHPHVFAAGSGSNGAVAPAPGAKPAPASAAPGTAAEQQLRWDELKKTEHGRGSVVAGVAMGQPALALAAKLGSRAARFGLEVPVPTEDSVDTVAAQIFRLAYAAGAAGSDPELEVRAIGKEQARRLAEAQPEPA